MFGLSPDEQARLFYVSILAIAALATVFALYRERLGAALQNAAIWGLIIVGLVLAYGFRDRVGLALFGGWPEVVGEDTVRLRRGDDAHFHAVLTINGQEIEFLVDTGASGIVLDPRDAVAAGFDLDRLAFTEEARTANGIVRGAPVTLDTVALGPFLDHDVRASVNEVPIGASLLGMSYLDRFGTVTISGDTLTLSR
jgi:aspartyl protease family protein